MSKFCTLIASLGIVIIIETLAYLVIGVIFGFGNIQAPAAICTKYEPDPILIARYGMGVKPILKYDNSAAVAEACYGIGAANHFIVTVVSFGMPIGDYEKWHIGDDIRTSDHDCFTVLTVQFSIWKDKTGNYHALPFNIQRRQPNLTGYLSKHLNSTLIRRHSQYR